MLYIVIVPGRDVQVHSPKPPRRYKADGNEIEIDFGDNEKLCFLADDRPGASWRLVQAGHPDYMPPWVQSSSEMTVITIDPAITEASFFGYQQPTAIVYGHRRVVDSRGATGVVNGDNSVQTNHFHSS